MKFVTATWYPYVLPLKQAWQSSRGRRNELRGELLQLTSDEGHVGWGDAAPLPEFGISTSNARRFARETALLDLCAHERRIPLNVLLSQRPAVPHVSTHCNLGSLSRIDAGSLRHLAQREVPAVKIKIGLANWREEILQLRRLARGIPAATQLRLDANQAWTFADAKAFIDACCDADLPIESLEEPLQAHASRQRFFNSLQQLQAGSPFPIAADESAHLIDHTFFSFPPVRRIIIKPARHGGLLGALHLARQAQDAGLDCLVTTALESACGLLACAHLAAAIDPAAIHGLHLPETLGKTQGEPNQEGKFRLPETNGLGFQAFQQNR